jgi:predicted RNA-binding protein with PIN domain
MIIIDGYNVIYKWECLSKLLNDIDLARERFINILANYQGYTDEEIVIVFDSSRFVDIIQKEEVGKNLKIVYAPANQGADLFIERLVASNVNPRSITVISDDSFERMAVFRNGASVMRSEQFEKEVIKVTKR